MKWLLVALVFVAACSPGAPDGVPSPSLSSPTTTPAVSPPVQTPAAAGAVAVRTSAAEFRVDSVVDATIINGTSKAIYSEDFKTDCSIAYLERQAAAGWMVVTGCALGRPTATVTIAAGQSHRLRFDPASFHLAPSGGRGFGAGTYRIRFNYRVDRVNGGNEPLAALSPPFVVG